MIFNKRTFYFVPAFLISVSSFAITEMDSVGVEKVGDKTFILHNVDAKETLFGISRRYQTPVGEIVEANAALKSGLKVGQQIRVPYVTKAEVPSGSTLHKVSPGETLFAISKKYNVSVSEIMTWNGLKGNDLSVGQALVIQAPQTATKPTVAETKVSEPAPTPVEPKKEVVEKTVAVVETPKSSPSPVKEEKVQPKAETKTATPALPTGKPIVPGDWISHEVKTGQTLFSIAGQYNAKVEDIINWNGLTSNNLRVGQVLKVGRAEPGPSQVPIVGEPRVVAQAEDMHVVPDGASSGGFKNIKEVGQAELIEGTGGHKKYLVLHRTAPVGTIMRVKNEENDATIFARVVGTLPETGDNSKLVIKLSQAAFDQLKAVNGRFPVEVMY
ncbi:LysM peptidoglycan-binding domain-containing protein [Algoriphagus sp. PAP.12]|uniref:LysM peptidoglycan-binding domain-containing protein n=1 Tax=Algoriphagus sp. PAP.12 TaxID=2996678 RepID=UPI00227C5E9C|nr:LysM peptidoglycan-binding domain-containing protein [Algoriphagus sp. PAP.12]